MGYIQWDTYLKDAFAKHPKKYIQSILSDILPRKFADMYIDTYYQNLKDTYASSISRADRESIAQSLGDGISIALLERRAGDEFVTAGGVCTSQIHSDTMESRIHSGLYFAGEVVNVDGVTGGFNLHACWAMGYVAGSNI
jgi:predicted flavoprotein YhiN